MNRWLKTFFILVPLAILIGCGGGQKVRKAASVVDTPEIHYDKGRAYLAENNVDQAFFEFQQAVTLNPKYAPAYEGMAWVYIARNNPDEAIKMADKALDLNGDWHLARVARARAYSLKGNHDKAIKEARKAVEKLEDSKMPGKKRYLIEAYLALGDIYRAANRYNEAQTTYMKVMDIDKTNQRAAKAIQELAAYRTAIAGERPELQRIAASKAITRADAAVLFALELPLKKIFRDVRPNQSGFRPPSQQQAAATSGNSLPPDVPGNFWARSFIQEVLEKGVMETFPDGTFKPNQKMTRAELAQVIQKFLVRYWQDPSLETKFFGTTSPFSDVNSTSPIFNAVMLVSTRNIIPGFDDGTFRPLETVSGTEAINIIKRLKAQL